MKKYIRLMPVILYPYVYIIVLSVLLIITKIVGPDSSFNDSIPIIIVVISIIFNLVALINAIFNSINSLTRKYTALESAKLNRFVKIFHIPAYILHFLLGLIAFILSVWGIPLLIWVFFIDFITIGISGIASIGCSIKLYREKYFSSFGTALLMGIMNFIYVGDVIVSCLYVKMIKQRIKRLNEEVQETA